MKMSLSLKETFADLAERWSIELLKASIAQQYEFGDGVDTPEDLVDAVNADDLEGCTDEVLCALERFNEELGYERVENWLMRYMLYLGSMREDKTNSTQAPTPAPTTTAAPTPASAPIPTTPAPAATPAVQPAAVVSKKPTYASFIPDNWEFGTNNWADFLQVADDVGNTEQVYTHDEDMQAAGIGIDPIQSNLHVEPIIDSPIEAGQFAKAMKSDPDVVLSSMKGHGGTGLALDMDNGRQVPIGQSAIEGICARAGFTRDGFERHMNSSEEDAARELNGQFRHGKGGTTVIESCGKIRAINSDRFAYGKISDIMRVFESFWKKNYPNAVVQAMYFSHTLAYWELNLTAYKNTIFNGFPDLQQSGYDPVLQFTTSNTANAAFRITPGLALPGGAVIPLCDRERGIRIRHSGAGNYTERVNNLMQNIIQSFSGCETMLSNASQNMEKMKNMKVNNATNALLRELDEIGFPRKQGREAAENFRNCYGTNQATGFDCFIAVANAYSFFVRDNPGNKQQQFECALRVGRAASCDWKALGDIPGEYKGY